MNFLCKKLACIFLLCVGLAFEGHAICFSEEPAKTPDQAVKPAEQSSKPITPAAKPASLAGAIGKALSDDADAKRKLADAKKKLADAAREKRVRAYVLRLRPQYQRMLYNELALLRRVCKPDTKPFAEVAKAADAGIEAPLREYVAFHLTPRRNETNTNLPDLHVALTTLLMPLVHDKLGPEKLALYRQECGKRTAAHKRTIVMHLVASLDDRLILSAEQRAKLVKSLLANYEPFWDLTFETYGFDGKFFPAIADKSIVPLLDDKQKSVWQNIEKLGGVGFSLRIGGDLFQGDATELQELAHIIAEGKNEK